MKKCRYERDAHRYLDGELTEAAAKKFESHLEQCEACRATLKELRSIKNIFAEGNLTDLPFEYEKQLIKKVKEQPAGRYRPLRPPVKRRSRRKFVLVAASIAVLLVSAAVIVTIMIPQRTAYLTVSEDMFKERPGKNHLTKLKENLDKSAFRRIEKSASSGPYNVTIAGRRDTSGNDSISAGGMMPPNAEPYDTTFFENYGVNPFISTEDETFSTFGMDVDTASYTIARRFIQDRVMPDKDSVRTEEFINYFDQDYPDTDGVFGIHTEGARSEFGKPHYHLLKIGIKANEVSPEERKPANMVFVVDVSGSMEREDRLEQVKRSLRMLANHLKEGDRIGLVVYGSRGRVISDLTSEKDEIFDAIDELVPDGSTNAEEGLILAYEMARRNFKKNKINRIILCSDGVANVGTTGADEILKQVKADAEKGITLTAIGFGMGNYNDVLMEKLANHGDGNYYYIDSDGEAERLFSDGAVSLLQTLASDAKIQVEFNRSTVDRFRLLGYENRRLNKEDFEDDTVDAGEVGAGQTVTALYELRIKDDAQAAPDALIATVRIRYMDLDAKQIQTNEKKVYSRDMTREFETASPRFRFTAAVAEFAELLKESIWAKDGSFDSVLKVAEGSVESLGGGIEREFIKLVKEANRIKKNESVHENNEMPVDPFE